MSRLWRRRSPPAGAAELAERFDELGLFELVDADTAARAREAFARKGIDALWTVELRRNVFAGDGEDLAEGGVGDFLRELRPHLDRLGAGLPEVEDRFSEAGYEVRVGDDVHAIYDESSVDRSWGLAWVRAFEIANELLAEAKSPERAYAMPEWDVWFLTQEQFEAIRSAMSDPRQRPYEPIDEPLWYGQEH